MSARMRYDPSPWSIIAHSCDTAMQPHDSNPSDRKAYPAVAERLLLTWKELRSYAALELNQEPDIWDALYRLHDRLDDHLVVVDETSVGTERGATAAAVVCLAVFRAPNPVKTLLYAAVTRQGEITVGLLDTLDLNKVARRFTGFDSLQAEVVSLAVTKRFRPLGDHLDLFAIVRASDGDAPSLAYHGIVWVDAEGIPHLAPALDDATPSGDANEWRPVAAQNLPDWLQQQRFGYSFDVDPFDEGVGRGLVALDEQFAGIYAIAAGSKLTAVAAGDQLVLHAPAAKDQARFDATERVHAIALDDRLESDICAVLGNDDRTLTEIRWRRVDTGYQSERRWHQALPGLPTAIALTETTQGSRERSPELLVGLHSGRLMRLRYLGAAKIREAWNRGWSVLGLADLDRRIEAARETVGDQQIPERHRMAALVGAIDALVHAQPAEPALIERRNDWSKALADVFSKADSRLVLGAGVGCLAEALRRAVEDTASGRHREAGVFIVALVLEVYQRSIPFADRERFDAVVRTLEARHDLDSDSSLRELMHRARLTGEWRWHENRPSPGPELTDPERVEWASLGLARWPSAYVPADTLGPDSTEASTPALGYVTLAGKLWLVVGRRDTLALHGIERYGQLTTQPKYRFRGPGAIADLMRIPSPQSDRLVVVERPGIVRVLGPHTEGAEYELRVQASHDPNSEGVTVLEGVTVAIARCDLESGGSALAVIRHAKRLSLLDLYRVSAEGIGTGQIALHYHSLSVGWAKRSVPNTTLLGTKLTLLCPTYIRLGMRSIGASGTMPARTGSPLQM